MTNRTLACCVLLAFALVPIGAQPDPGTEELKLKLSKPMFIGTPSDRARSDPASVAAGRGLS